MVVHGWIVTQACGNYFINLVYYDCNTKKNAS